MPGRNFIGVHLEIGLFACSLGVDWALVRGSSISLVLVVRPFCRILLRERTFAPLSGSAHHAVSYCFPVPQKLKPAMESFPVMGHEPHTAMMPMFIAVFGFQ